MTEPLTLQQAFDAYILACAAAYPMEGAAWEKAQATCHRAWRVYVMLRDSARVTPR